MPETTLEATAARERRNGYHVNLCCTKDGWECRLECGVDVLPANMPRPRAFGETAFEALDRAGKARDRLVAGVKV